MAGWTGHIGKQRKMRPYEHFAKDHLGNVRVVFSPNGRSAMRVQEDHYYPFGMPMPYTHYASSSSTPNRLLYNSKELLNYLPGLRWYDYGARMYDAQVGRCYSIDPVAEVSRRFSPYSYCYDNPIRFIDVDGLIPIDEIVKGGKISSKFGHRNRQGKLEGHWGVDIGTFGKTGLPVRAAAGGIVEIVKWDRNKPESAKSGYGLYIVINHGNGYYTLYGHLQAGGVKVKQGDKVSNGQIIALSGNTGDSDGPHTHFEIINTNLAEGGLWVKENRIDPESIDDLEEYINNGYQNKETTVNEGYPTEIEEVIVTAKGPILLKPLDARLEDLLWQSVRPNAFGNTGRYNQPGRRCDQYYSDDFLKWYYGK